MEESMEKNYVEVDGFLIGNKRVSSIFWSHASKAVHEHNVFTIYDCWYK